MSRVTIRPETFLPKNRLEAFSDGVLAIVITILVLELKVPEVSGQQALLSALAEDWRSFAGYLISFVFVGGCWIAHSNATRLVDRGDPILFRFTLVWLLFVSLIPFSTALMTSYIGDPGEEVAVAIYGIDLFLASLFLNLIIRYSASKEGLVAGEVADEELLATLRQRKYVLILQLAGVGLALFEPSVAIAFYLLASLLFIIGPLFTLGRARRKPA